jgi:hypothetical protein
MALRNSDPKSEMPAMKQRAAKAKDKRGRDQSIAREKPAPGKPSRPLKRS